MVIHNLIDFFSGKGGVPKVFEIFPGKAGGVAKISKFRGHLLSSGHHKNSGELGSPSELCFVHGPDILYLVRRALHIDVAPENVHTIGVPLFKMPIQ